MEVWSKQQSTVTKSDDKVVLSSCTKFRFLKEPLTSDLLVLFHVPKAFDQIGWLTRQVRSSCTNIQNFKKSGSKHFQAEEKVAAGYDEPPFAPSDAARGWDNQCTQCSSRLLPSGSHVTSEQFVIGGHWKVSVLGSMHQAHRTWLWSWQWHPCLYVPMLPAVKVCFFFFGRSYSNEHFFKYICAC